MSPPPPPNAPERLVERMLQGDKLSLARLITMVEGGGAEAAAVLEAVHPRLGRAHRIGVTGPPGAGKSTLVDRLIGLFRKEGRKVGVLAVDPSSPFTGGAVLGDRIRMQEHSTDEGVFIRSLGSRGNPGGLARSTGEAADLLDAFGASTILIETVGVGQTELDILRVADTVLLVLVPESGDTIQTLKAGILEIADLFVVNKADREGAERMAADLESMLHLEKNGKGWSPPVLLAAAIEGRGIEEVAAGLDRHRAWLGAGGGLTERRQAIREEALMDLLAQAIRRSLEGHRSSEGLSRWVEAVRGGTLSPHAAVRAILRDRDLLVRLLAGGEE